jgi:hypothetical protein
MHEGLTEVFAELLQKVLGQLGFELPLHFVAVANNGAVLVVRYTATKKGPNATVLAEHCEGPTFPVPINLMVADARGKAAHAVLDLEGAQIFDMTTAKVLH